MHSSDFSAFVIDILYTVGQRLKQFLWDLYPSYLHINIKTFNRVDRKQLNILERFLEYLEFLLMLIEDDSLPSFRWLVAKCIHFYYMKWAEHLSLKNCIQLDGNTKTHIVVKSFIFKYTAEIFLLRLFFKVGYEHCRESLKLLSS